MRTTGSTERLESAARWAPRRSSPSGRSAAGRSREWLPAAWFRSRSRSWFLRLHQAIELAGALQLVQLLESADVPLADEYLRDRAPTAPCNHIGAKRGIGLDIDLAKGN